MADVVISEFMHEGSVREISARFDTHHDPDLWRRPRDLTASVGTARALVVRNKTRVDEPLLSAAPQLLIVARLGVGLDNIDVTACTDKGVVVAPATGANAIAVAEYVIGSMLNLIRGVFQSTGRVIAGEWPREDLRGGELSGRRLGLVGYGLISREVAARALSMGMDVAGHDPYLTPDDEVWGEVHPVALEELLRSSDVVSIHVPLTPETTHLVGARAITSMRSTAIVINTSRGGVVDERAVIAALTEGRLGGAALDVFETEPVDEAAGRQFDRAPNLILTPHVAGITMESERRIGELTVAAVRRHLE